MYEIYTANPNDTLQSISKNYNTTVEKLLELNGLSNNYIIEEGTQIIVPANQNNPYTYYTVKKGDNIYQIAKKYDTNSDLLLKINGLDKDDYIYPNQTIIIPRKGFTLYITKENETLKELTDNLNIATKDLLNENPNIYLERNQIIIFKEK